MAQAPAHCGIRVLGPEHGGNIVESCLCRGTDIDVHHPTLTRGCLPSRLTPQSPIMIIFPGAAWVRSRDAFSPTAPHLEEQPAPAHRRVRLLRCPGLVTV